MSPSPAFSRRAALRGGLGLGSLLVTGTITGCGAVSSSGSQAVSFWSQLAGSKKKAGVALAQAFAKQNSGITVDESLYGSPDQLNQKLLTGIVGGILPDLFIQHWDYSLIYASGGKLSDLDQLLRNASGLTPAFANYSRLHNQLVTAPLYGTSRALTINKDLVRAAGIDPERPPRTWDDIRGWARELTRWSGSTLEVAGLHVYSNDLELFEVFTLLLQGAGGSLLTPAGDDIAFDSEAGVDAVTFLRQLVVLDRVTVPGFGIGDSSSAPFPSGRAAFAVNGNYGLNAAETAGVDLGVATMPGRDGGYTSLIDPFAFAIPAAADNVEAAAAYVDFALSPEQQVAFAAASRNIPANATAGSDPKLTEDVALAAFVEASRHAPEAAPVTPAFTRMVPVVARAIQDVFFGRAEPAEAIAMSADQIRPFVQQGS